MSPSQFLTSPTSSRKPRLKSKTLNLAIAVAIVSVMSIPTSLKAAAVRTVALTGQQVPGLPNGVTFGSFSVGSGGNGVVLNNVGQTAFDSFLSGAGVDVTNNRAIWSEEDGSLGLVARTGDQPPGMPSGVLYGSVGTVRLNDAGQTAFIGTLTGSGVDASNDQSIWSTRLGSLALVAREGDQAPGAPDGVRLGPITNSLSFCFNNAGRIAFSALDSTNASSLWAESAGGLELVARSGSQAPGAPSGVNFNGLGTQQNFNDAGQTAFQAGLTGINTEGIFAGNSGSLRAVALNGDQAPGAAAGVTFISFTSSTDLNNAGRVSFAARIFGPGVVLGANNQGIWSEASGSLALVVRAGDHAPGTPSGVNFATLFNFWDPVLNDAGALAFIAGLTGPGVVPGTNSQGIWSNASGSLALVVREVDQAPGMAPGTNFASFLNSHLLNNAGQVALLASLTNGKGGLWATDRDGALQYIVCEGDLLEVATGDFRTIQSFRFFGETGNGDGRPSGFNNLGQLAFSASFTDGTSGIFVSNAVAQLPGDYNNDGKVDAADYVVWRKTGSTSDDYNTWRTSFGRSLVAGSGSVLLSAESLSAAVPEPTTVLLLGFTIAGGVLCGRRLAPIS
jgi:hypothetical protein